MLKDHMRSKSLRYRTLLLVRESEKSNRQIAEAVGTTAPWVAAFRSGSIKNPGVNTIQRLYEHLAGEPLFKD